MQASQDSPPTSYGMPQRTLICPSCPSLLSFSPSQMLTDKATHSLGPAAASEQSLLQSAAHNVE